MDHTEEKDYQHRIFTIPNCLTTVRLLLIPLFVWLYVGKHDYPGTTIVLVLSGITDTLDGIIARHFHMISDLGKALDPIADKLTQIAMLFCLVTRFHLMLIPLGILIVKEVTDGVMSLIILKRTKKVYSADWHGKITTFMLYVTMILHVICFDIPASLSTVLIIICSVLMTFSFVMYIIRNTRLISASKEQAA